MIGLSTALAGPARESAAWRMRIISVVVPLATPARESASWLMISFASAPTGPVGRVATWLMNSIRAVAPTGPVGRGATWPMYSSCAGETLAAPARESASWRMVELAEDPTGPVGRVATWRKLDEIPAANRISLLALLLPSALGVGCLLLRLVPRLLRSVVIVVVVLVVVVGGGGGGCGAR